MVKSQHQYNQESLDRRGCKKIGIVVRKDDIDRFHAMRRESGLSVPDFFSSLLEGGYQLQPEQPEPEPVNILQPDKPEPEPVNILQPDQTGTNTADAINLTMPTAERNAYALELLQQHGGDKGATMATLRIRLQQQYPGFSVDRSNKSQTAELAKATKFYSSISDYLGRYLKGQKAGG